MGRRRGDDDCHLSYLCHLLYGKVALSCQRAMGKRGLVVGFPFRFVLSEVPSPGCCSLGPGQQRACRGPGAQLSRDRQCMGKKQPLPYQVHMLLMELRKTLRESYNRLCETWFLRIDIPVNIYVNMWISVNMCLPTFLGVSGWGHFPATCCNGWVGYSSDVQGGWDPSVRALFSSSTQTTGSFSQGSSSYNEVICLPCLLLFGWVCCCCFRGFFVFLVVFSLIWLGKLLNCH